MVLQQQSGCPVYDFRPRITFGNDLRLAAGMHGIQLPAGLDSTNAPAPKFVYATTMNSLRRSPGGGHGNTIGIVHGLTVAEFAVSFHDHGRQWRQIRTDTVMPFWQFQGGDVFLDLKITVYALKGEEPQPEDVLTQKIFALIMGHELLHVLDEIEIVSRWMAPKAYLDEKVLKFLTNAEPVDNGMFETWFRGNGFSNWLRDGLWADEHNRRGGLRDTPEIYKGLQEEIGALRRQIINRPSH